MRTVLLTAILGLIAFPAGALADPWKDESGKGWDRKEGWKKQEEFWKQERKRNKEYWKSVEEREREAEKRARERYPEGRYYEYGPRYETSHGGGYYAPEYVPAPPVFRQYDDRQRLEGHGQIGPYRFEIWR